MIKIKKNKIILLKLDISNKIIKIKNLIKIYTLNNTKLIQKKV
jgi:hypothetical protein